MFPNSARPRIASLRRRLVPTLVACGLAVGGLVPAAVTVHAQTEAEPGSRHAGLDRILPTAPALVNAVDRARSIVQELRTSLEFPGIQVAVATRSGILWSEGLGLADRDRALPVTRRTVFRIYSVSKGLTGTALARLHQSGRIDLDADVRRYVPWFPAKRAPITVRQLAGHLGGIRHYRPGAGEGTALVRCSSPREGVARFAADTLMHAPGTAFGYTSFGFVLLSAAMSAATGDSFERTMREALIEPYGLTSTTLDPAGIPIRDLASRYEYRDSLGVVAAARIPLSCKFGAGAYYSTAEDVARLAAATAAGEGLSAEAHRQLLTPQRDAAGDEVPASLGWDVVADSTGARWLRRTGGNEDGWSAVMASLAGDVAVAILANMRGRDWMHDEAADIARLFIAARDEAGGDDRATSEASASATAFIGVNVLPMDREELLTDQTVLIEDDRIVRYGPRATVEVPDGARRLEAPGAYLLPGLVDAHAHAGAEALPLYVAAGVTTVRMMHGFPERLENRRLQAEASLPWPNLLTSGPLIAGEEVPWTAEVVETAAAARALVDAQADAGYDFLKVYDGLSGSVYAALAERAGQRGIPLAGHVPMEVGLERVLATGQRTVEHAEQLLYATFGRDGIMSLPTSRTDTVVALFERHSRGTCVTPTLRAMTLAMRRGTAFTDRLFESLDAALVDPELASWWDTYRSPAPENARPRREHFLEVQADLALKLHAVGVPLLAGTDTPYPLLLPGRSLVEEVKTLASLGLSPFEALATATVNAGACLHPDGDFGVIRAGARADLLLLGRNPLSDLDALDELEGVMVRGRWFPRSSFANMVDGVRAAYATEG